MLRIRLPVCSCCLVSNYFATIFKCRSNCSSKCSSVIELRFGTKSLLASLSILSQAALAGSGAEFNKQVFLSEGCFRFSKRRHFAIVKLFSLLLMLPQSQSGNKACANYVLLYFCWYIFPHFTVIVKKVIWRLFTQSSSLNKYQSNSNKL